MAFPIHSLVEHLFRRQSAQIVSTLTRALGGRQSDWHRIVECYEALARLTGSPIVGLNCAIARAQVVGASAALVEIERIASRAGRLSFASRGARRIVA